MTAFLFTDIEASTRLWEEHPEAMAPALARHDAILREAIASVSGEVVKSTGDGMLAIFDTATAAVAAGLAAQLALAVEPWPADPIRVRMGIHIGDGEARDGDWYGPAVNRAARIMAAGHGGQVLLSGLAAEMATLPDGASLRDLGVHRLKDLTLPERLQQLLHAGIEADFPPPATLDATANNLPVQVTEFFGRDEVLGAVSELVDSPATRLITLTGPGGTGKTRLALQVAADLLDHFRHGVYFIDLSSETTPDAAFESIVDALDLPVSSGSPLRVLTERLRDRQMLLVLDNLEQVMGAAPGVAELIQHCPDLNVLATSREALRVRAERVFPVPPLSVPRSGATQSEIASSEAARLFVERARTVRPDVELTEDNAAAVADICRRLDGLPLAIELAAARLNIFSPLELRDRLQGTLDILGTGNRDLPDRQRTLWGAIGWSYELLDDTERDVFRLMSVFSPARMGDIEAVASDALDGAFILDALASLVDKSLVRAEDGPGGRHFSMLLTIREFATDRLDEWDHADAIRRAHASTYTRAAHRMAEDLAAGRKRTETIAELTTGIGNLRAAWRFWVEAGAVGDALAMIEDLWSLHEAAGWYNAAIDLADDALALLDDPAATPEQAADRLTIAAGRARAIMAVHGHTVEAEEAFQDVRRQWEAAPPEQRLPATRPLASYHIGIADWDAAFTLGGDLLEQAATDHDTTKLIDGHYLVGIAGCSIGDIDQALTHMDEAIELSDSHPPVTGRLRLGPSTRLVSRVGAGLTMWLCGALEQSVSHLAQALEIARELGHPYGISYGLFHNGILNVYRGRPENTLEYARELSAVAGANDFIVWKTLSSMLEGVAVAQSGDHDRGIELTEQGITVYRGLSTPPVFWPYLGELRSMVFGMAGEAGKALSLIDEAIAVIGGREEILPQFWIQRGDMLVAADAGSQDAEEAYLTAIRGATARGMHLISLQGWTRIVRLRRSGGSAPDGSEELRRLYGRFTEGLTERDLVAAGELLQEV